MEKGQLARALYSNTPESQYELYFRKGDILTVLEYDPDGQTGWWLCALRGERGLCPGNYLELMENRYSVPIVQDEESEKKNALEAALETYDVPRPYVRPESPLPKPNPLDLYDVPRNQMPIYAAVNKSTQLKHRQNRNGGEDCSSNSGRASVNSKRASDLSMLSNGSSFSSSSGTSSLSFHSAASSSGLGSKLSSKQLSTDSSASASSSHDVEVEYDVPRPSVRVQSALNGNGAVNGSKFSLHDPHDDRIENYDVPRPSVKALAAQFVETKYDRGSSSPPVLRRNQNNNSNNARLRNHHYSMYVNEPGHAASYTKPHSLITNGSTASLPQLMKYPPAGKRSGQILSQDFNVLSRDLRDEIYDVVPHQQTSKSTMSLFNKRPSFDSMSLKKGKSTDSFEKFCEIATAADLESRRRASILFGADGMSIMSGSTSQFNLFNDQEDGGPAQVKALPLSPKAAVSVCEKLRQEVVTSISSILQYVQPKWRQKENLVEIMPEIRFGCVRLNLAIKDLTAFSSRTVTNANKPGTETILSARLQRLLTPLVRSSRIIERDVEELEAYMWSPDRLSVSPHNPAPANDPLDQLVLCAQSLTHDVTEMANFIALNSTTLFREEPPPQNNIVQVQVEPEPEQNQVADDEDYADCDYVMLEPIKKETPQRFSIPPVQAGPPQPDPHDSQILEFYSTQIATCAPLLSTSISKFITSVQQNDSPHIFNGHLKYVILLAYKMLFVGDTVHSNINNADLKEQIQTKSDELHRAVVALHDASKQATREFPQILPMQVVIDQVWQTTAAANQLKSIIFNATCQ